MGISGPPPSGSSGSRRPPPLPPFVLIHMKDGERRRGTLPLSAQAGNKLTPTSFSLEIEISCRVLDGRKSFNFDIIGLNLTGLEPTQAQLRILDENYWQITQSWLILKKKYLGKISLPVVSPETKILILEVELDGRKFIAAIRNRLSAPSTSGS